MKYRIQEYPDLWEKVKSMSPEELLMEVVCPDLWKGREPIRNTGAVFIHPTDREDAFAKAAEVNRDREIPALIASDLEYGAGNMIRGATVFPSLRAVAETGDEALAYRMGAIAAQEACAAGYRWAFGPCVDILGDPFNPIVSIRTPGEDADTVIRFGGAYMRGMQDNGLIAAIKHFPGDGYGPVDQHVSTAQNPLSREEWDASFGKVYRALIDQGAKSVMIGHIGLAAYDEIDPEYGIAPPATVSKNLMTHLLKEKLGFEGLIVSDAVNMGGLAGYCYLYEAFARFLEGGGDCLLFVRNLEEYRVKMLEQMEAGVLTLESLQNRAWRMLCFRREAAEEAAGRTFEPVDSVLAENTARAVGAGCVKVVRDRRKVLPLRLTKASRVAHVILFNDGYKDFSVTDDLTRRLSEVCEVEALPDPGPEKLRRIAASGEYEAIVVSVLCRQTYGTNAIRLSGPMARNMSWGWMKYGVPTVFVSYYSPYFGEEYPAAVDTLINTYGVNLFTNEGVIRLLLGQ